jgi:hypothetical protein
MRVAPQHHPRDPWRVLGRQLTSSLMLVTLVACDVGPEAMSGVAAQSQSQVDPAQWSTLIEAQWTLEAGTEGFVCALQTVKTDLYIRAFQAEAPYGTHHTLLTVTEPKGPDGVFECGPGTLSDAMIFSSGIDSGDLVFPEGVAIRVPAGKQILLNLHLLNASPEPISGISGTWIQTLDEHEVVHEAEVLFAGTVDFAIPPGGEASATGSCVFEEDATVVSLWPHMHGHGRHMTVEHHSPGGVDTLHDAAFDFGHQLHHSIQPTTIRAGERIDVTCQWLNTSDQVVGYGDSSTQEMCFAGLVRYPASSRSLYCDMPFG